MSGAYRWASRQQRTDNMTKIRLFSPLSINYKIVLESQKTFKSDGAVSAGKKIIFRNGHAEVDADQEEFIKQVKGYGVDFFIVDAVQPVETPAAPRVSSMDSQSEKDQNKIGELEKAVSELKDVIKQLTVAKSQPEKENGEEDQTEDEQEDEKKTVRKRKEKTQ